MGLERSLHIVVAHESYLHRGGEDRVVESEVALLRNYGHDVTLLTRKNEELERISSLSLLKQTFWSGQTTDDLTRIHQAKPIDILHVHNTVPLISPSIYWAASKLRIPVVQTLHNFRLLCPQAMFLREGKVCEDCLGKVPWRGAVRSCYRDSAADSAALAGMLTFHRSIGTWQHRVQRYIALNEFCKQKFIQGGLPEERISVKPNFVDDLGEPERGQQRQGFLYVGRLSSEKGIDTLAAAFRTTSQARLRIAGSGPAQSSLSVSCPAAVQLGEISSAAVRSEMLGATALVLPSICYENCPMVLVEAFAAGLPVVASRTESLAEAIEEGVTGLLFEPGSHTELAEKLLWATEHPSEMQRMGRAARAKFLIAYAAPANYQALMEIYRSAV